MNLFSSILLIGAGFLPSIFWLLIYLRNDCHPEPKRTIIRVFIAGMILAPLAAVFQYVFDLGLASTISEYSRSSSLSFFTGAAFIEEFVKFATVFAVVLYSKDFDEPIDAMIYMITAGLGFAALENIFFLFTNINNQLDSGLTLAEGLKSASVILFLRSFGATLLHTLASAIMGYFLAMAWFYHHHSKKIMSLGLLVATVIHLAFNLGFVVFDPQTTSYPRQTSFLFSSGIIVVLIVLVGVLFLRVYDRRNRYYESQNLPQDIHSSALKT